MYFLISGVILGLICIKYLNDTNVPLTAEQKKKKNDDYLIERKAERLNSRQQMIKNAQKRFTENPKEYERFRKDASERQERILKNFSPKQRQEFLEQVEKARQRANEMADRADGIGEEEFKPINEDETLGYWINRILLSFILIGFYTVGIKAASFPTYTELFDAFSDKIEGYYSV